MRTWLPLFAVCLGAFLLITDTTVVTVALPELAVGLRASLAEQQWVQGAYPLILAVLALSAGSLGDRFGQLRVFRCSVALFGLASLGCALAPTIGLLIAARCAQAVGGAALFTTAMSLLAASYTGRARGTAFGVFTAVLGVAGALGPILGGLLTQALTWRAIFVINVPLAAITLTLTATIHATTPTKPARIDLPGTLTFGIAAGALSYALIAAKPALFPVAAVALAAFVAIERRSTAPMLDLRLLASRSVAGILFGVLTSAAVFAQLIYASLWLQSTVRLGPIPAGLALMPMAAALFVASTLIGKRLSTLPARLTLPIGALLAAIGSALNWLLAVDAITLLPGLVLTGIGMGIAGPATSTALLAAAPPDRAGMASGAMATVRQLGQTLGVAVLGIGYPAGIGVVFLLTSAFALLGAITMWIGTTYTRITFVHIRLPRKTANARQPTTNKRPRWTEPR
ncbi:MAG TPA: MFS transporter [Pseudonocardiaceae bacterium]|jgi:EmrB/QacA subfamily drug resistance transporter